MEDDIGQHDCDQCASHANPGLGPPEGIEKYHETKGQDEKTDPGQKRRVQKKGDDGDKNMTPFQASPRIRQLPLSAFAQYGFGDKNDGKCSGNQA
jgi:hypothetical protein